MQFKAGGGRLNIQSTSHSKTPPAPRRRDSSNHRRGWTERIRIRRVYETPNAADGYRILVDRVWPRGMTKERVRASLWLKSIAPSAALRTWFNHDPSRWQMFKRRYYIELGKNSDEVKRLRDAIAQGTVTLLYAAKDDKRNQAVALKEYLLAILNR